MESAQSKGSDTRKPGTPLLCSRCGEIATTKCILCDDVPRYFPAETMGAHYCSSACQSADWKWHEARCHDLGPRKRLLRAAKILRATLLEFAKMHYTHNLFKSIELTVHGDLYLHPHPLTKNHPEFHQDAFKVLRQICLTNRFYPFASSPTASELPVPLSRLFIRREDEEAILTVFQNPTALFLLSSLIQKLLKSEH